MSLSDDDKKYIQQLIKNALDTQQRNTKVYVDKSNKTLLEKLDKKEKDDRALREAIATLDERSQNGKSTLSEEILLKKLQTKQLIKDVIPEGVLDALTSTAESLKETAKTIDKGIQGVASSNTGRDLQKAIMYSNPLTAAIYENRDLFGGLFNIGKGVTKAGYNLTKGVIGAGAEGIWSLLQGKKSQNENYPGTSLVPVNSTSNLLEEATKSITAQNLYITGSNNYIVAKQALFEDCENYINIAWKKQGNQGLTGSYTLPALPDSQSEVLTLTKQADGSYGPNTKNQLTVLSKGMNGLVKAATTTNALLSAIKDKSDIIVKTLEIGALAILGMVMYFKNQDVRKIVDDVLAPLPGIIGNISKDVISWMTQNLKGIIREAMKTKDGSDNAYITGHIKRAQQLENKTSLTRMNTKDFTDYVRKNKDKLGHLNDPNMVINGGKSYLEYEVSGLTPVLAPFDCFIRDVIIKRKKETMYYEIIISPIQDDVIKLDKLKLENIIQPQVGNDQRVYKGQILGFADSTFKITGTANSIKNLNGDMFDQIVAAEEDNYNKNLDITAKNRNDKALQDIDKNVYKYATKQYKQAESNRIRYNEGQALLGPFGTPINNIYYNSSTDAQGLPLSGEYEPNYSINMPTSNLNAGNKTVETIKQTINNIQPPQPSQPQQNSTINNIPNITVKDSQKPVIQFSPNEADKIYQSENRVTTGF